MKCPMCSALLPEESIKCGVCDQILPTWARANAAAASSAVKKRAADAAAPSFSLARVTRYAFLAAAGGAALFLLANYDEIGATASSGALGGTAQAVQKYIGTMKKSVRSAEAAKDLANAHTSEMEKELERTGEFTISQPDKAPVPVAPPPGLLARFASIWTKAETARRSTDAQTDQQAQQMKIVDGDAPKP